MIKGEQAESVLQKGHEFWVVLRDRVELLACIRQRIFNVVDANESQEANQSN